MPASNVTRVRRLCFSKIRAIDRSARSFWACRRPARNSRLSATARSNTISYSSRVRSAELTRSRPRNPPVVGRSLCAARRIAPVSIYFPQNLAAEAKWPRRKYLISEPERPSPSHPLRARRSRARERAHQKVRERGAQAPTTAQAIREVTSLSLGVLRGFAGSLEAVLLSLLHARVAGQKPGLTQGKAVALRIELKQSSSDAVADRPGLTGYAAALDLDLSIERALGPGDAERQAHVGFVDGVAEMSFEGSIVDDDRTRAGDEPHPRDRGLAAPGSVVERWGRHGAPPPTNRPGRWARW